MVGDLLVDLVVLITQGGTCDMARDYSKMFDTPQDHERERKVLQAFYRKTVIRVSSGQMTMLAGGQQVFTTARHMKHKSFIVQGKHVK